ncbi:MAG: fimbrillin family protein [Prevotella sp.]|nr:fimbrillin family protein [Prevotella sp.]
MKRTASFSQSALIACLLADVAWLLSACSKASEYYEDETDKAIRSQAVIVTDENGNESTLTEGSTIGVYVMGEDGGISLHKVEVDEDGNAILPTFTQEETIIAYTPFQDEWGVDALTSNPIFTVKSDQSTQEQYDASDLMIASLNPADAKDGNGLRFRHVLAKVAIHVIDETGRLELNQINVKLHTIKNSVWVDLLHQTVTTIPEQCSDILMLSKITTDWRISSYAIVAPQKIADGTTFLTVMLFGVNYTYPIPQASTLEAGKTYTINIRLTLNGLIPDGWSITDWDDEGEGNIDIEV